MSNAQNLKFILKVKTTSPVTILKFFMLIRKDSKSKEKHFHTTKITIKPIVKTNNLNLYNIIISGGDIAPRGRGRAKPP